jgi:hypothetical protein
MIKGKKRHILVDALGLLTGPALPWRKASVLGWDRVPV